MKTLISSRINCPTSLFFFKLLLKCDVYRKDTHFLRAAAGSQFLTGSMNWNFAIG